MTGLFRRPLAICAALYLTLLFAALRSGLTAGLPLCIGLLLIALLVLGIGAYSPQSSRRQRGLFWAVGLLLAASLAMGSAYRVDHFGLHHKIDPYDQAGGQGVITVRKVEYSGTYSAALIGDLESLDGTPLGITGRVNLPYPAPLSPGDRISLPLTLTVHTPYGNTLADCYDYSQGIFFTAEGSEEESLQLLSRESIFPETQLDGLRTSLRRLYYPYLSYEDSSLLHALLTGDTDGLSTDLQDQFRNLGITHALSVSGLHLTVLCGSFLWILRKLRLPRSARFPLILPILAFYLLLVGTPSALRAGGMTLLMLAAYYFGRQNDSITSLFATVTLICLISPESVLDVGLMLSFFSTWGILTVAVPICRIMQSLNPVARWILTALCITGSATLFTLPFAVWYFGEWAILSPIANLILVPLLTLLLYLAPVLLILSPIPPLAALPALLIRHLSRAISMASAFLGGQDSLLLPLDYPAVKWMALLFLLLVPILCIPRKTRPLTLAAAILFLSLSGGYSLYHSYDLLPQRECLYHRQDQDSILTLRAGSRVMLVDHTDGTYGFLSQTAEDCQEDPSVSIDSLLLTGYRYRQISSLTRLIDRQKPAYLILPIPDEEDYDLAYCLAERASRMGCLLRWYSPEEPVVEYHDYRLIFSFGEDGEMSALSITQGGGGITYTVTDEGILVPVA